MAEISIDCYEMSCEVLKTQLLCSLEMFRHGEIDLPKYVDTLKVTLSRLEYIKIRIEELLCTNLGQAWSTWVGLTELESFASEAIASSEMGRDDLKALLMHGLQ